MYDKRFNRSDLVLSIELGQQIPNASKRTSRPGGVRKICLSPQDFAVEASRNRGSGDAAARATERRVGLRGPDFRAVRTAVMLEVASFADEDHAGGLAERTGKRALHQVIRSAGTDAAPATRAPRAPSAETWGGRRR